MDEEISHITQVSDEKLQSFAYNKLRSLAVKLGIGGKGTKVALIKRISDHRDSLGGFGGHEGPESCINNQIEESEQREDISAPLPVKPVVPNGSSKIVMEIISESVDLEKESKQPTMPESELALLESVPKTTVQGTRDSWFRTIDDTQLDSISSSTIVSPNKKIIDDEETLSMLRTDIDLVAITTFYSQMSSKFQDIYKCGAPEKMDMDQFDKLSYPEFRSSVCPANEVTTDVVATPLSPKVAKSATKTAAKSVAIKKATKTAAPVRLVTPIKKFTGVVSAKKVACIVKTPTQSAAKAAVAKAASRVGRIATKKTSSNQETELDAECSLTICKSMTNLTTTVESEGSSSSALSSLEEAGVCEATSSSISIPTLTTTVTTTSTVPAPAPASAPRSRVMAMASAINKKLTAKTGVVKTTATRATRTTRSIPAVTGAVITTAVCSSAAINNSNDKIEANITSDSEASVYATEATASKSKADMSSAVMSVKKPTPVAPPVCSSKQNVSDVSAPCSAIKTAPVVVVKPRHKAMVNVVKSTENAPVVIAATPMTSAVKPKRVTGPVAVVAGVGASAVKSIPTSIGVKATPARAPVPVPSSSLKPVGRPCASVASTPAASAVKRPAPVAVVPSVAATAPLTVLITEPEAPAENPLAWAMLSSPVRNDMRNQSDADGRANADQNRTDSDYNITPVKAKPATDNAEIVLATPKSTPINPTKRTIAGAGASASSVSSSAYKTPVIKPSSVSKTPLMSESTMRRVAGSAIRTPLSSTSGAISSVVNKPLGSQTVTKPSSTMNSSSTLYQSTKKIAPTVGGTARKQVLSQSLMNSSRAAMMGVSAGAANSHSTFKPNLHSSLYYSHGTAIKKSVTGATVNIQSTARMASTAIKMMKPPSFKCLAGNKDPSQLQTQTQSSGTDKENVQISQQQSADDNLGVNPFLFLIAE